MHAFRNENRCMTKNDLRGQFGTMIYQSDIEKTDAFEIQELFDNHEIYFNRTIFMLLRSILLISYSSRYFRN